MIVVKTSVCLSMCTNTLLYVCSPSKPCPFQHTRIISPVILRRCWCYYWIISQPKRLTMYYKHSKWPTIYTQLFRITSNQLVYTDLMDHRNPHHRQKKKPTSVEYVNIIKHVPKTMIIRFVNILLQLILFFSPRHSISNAHR